MNKKYLVLPAVLLVAAAVVAAIQLWPSQMKELRAQNLCLGMLGEKTAGLLDDGMYSLGSSSVFQIDANYGTPVAMVEMLVQSRPGRVELLPALPEAWAASGSVTGIGVRGNLGIDMSWTSGQVTSATLHGAAGRTTTVAFGSWTKAVTIPSTGAVTVTPPAQYTVFQLVNRKSGRAIDVPGADTSAGTGLIRYTPSSAANQRFHFVPVGGGLHEMLTTHGATPPAWDISGASASEGAKLVHRHPTHAGNQQWTVTDTGDGYVTLTCAHSRKVLGVTGDSTTDGATIEQQTANGRHRPAVASPRHVSSAPLA